MKIAFRRFRPDDEAAIERLNRRLAAAGLPHRLGGERPDAGEPDLDDAPLIERLFVATQDHEIRGAVWLKEQRFWCREGVVRAGWMIYPVSESLFDRRFAGVPGTLLFGLLRQQPRLMALGMGGEAGPFARLLASARWDHKLVPFWFRPVDIARCLQQVRAVRPTRPRRILADVLARSGLGRLGLAAVSRLRGSSAPSPAGKVETVERFGPWADALWERERSAYRLAAERDSRALNALYPNDFVPVTRLRVRGGGRDLGWVCVQTLDAGVSRLRDHFGGLRLGIVTDAWAGPDDATPVLDAGVRHLLDDGAELIVANLSHVAWCAAARMLGFWRGPSTLAFSWSPALTKLLSDDRDHCFLTRSDGDGPERLPPG